MTSKERGQFIRKLLSRSGIRIGNTIRSYFGIDRDRCSLEEIGDEYECSTRTLRDRLNKGVNKIRVFLTHTDKMFREEHWVNNKKGMEEEIKICKQLKEYVEGINPDLIQKELPYYYSKFLDEFMLCLIDGVENTTSRSSKKYKLHMILREIGDEMGRKVQSGDFSKMSQSEIDDYRSKRLREMGDGMYRKV